MRSLYAALLVLGCGGDGTTPLVDGSMASPDLAVVFTPAPHPAWPKFQTGDNQVLSPMTLVSIVAQNDTVGSRFLDFGDKLVSSQWWAAVSAEYGLGAPQKNVRVTGPAISNNVTEDQLVAYIDALVKSNAAPAPDGNTVYLVYLPDNVVESSGGVVNTNCNDWEGYHLPYGNGGDNWGFAQRCYHNGQEGIDDATNTGSHEIFESASDPTGNGWTLPFPGATPWNESIWDIAGYGAVVELADACSGTAFVEGGFQFQRSWSNAAAAKGGDPCVPSVSDPYFNVSPASGWTQVAAGATVKIALTGWTTAPMGDFYVEQSEITSTGGSWTASVSAARTYKFQGTDYPAINNGEAATLSVTAPANAPSGSYWATMVFTTAETPGSDLYHGYPVGAYVP